VPVRFGSQFAPPLEHILSGGSNDANNPAPLAFRRPRRGCMRGDASQSTAPNATAVSGSVSVDRSSKTDERYVAIGTSISMGWESNGVYDASQRLSWPALLGFATDHGISLPLIQSPGCTSPIVAPLGGGLRLSGESISGSTVCASNDAGVTLPTQNVALAAALAADAVQTTPEAATSYPWFSRVLPPGTTELTAALSQHPTIVSVELGGNEVLNATSGLVAPGVTVVPLPYFTTPYDALLDALEPTGAKAVLVGLPADARNLPALRRGDEIWADRAEFASLHVDVSNDCNGNQNYINVSIKSLNLAFTAAFMSSHGLPNPVFSCADIPGTQDLVLTPADIATINGYARADDGSHQAAGRSARVRILLTRRTVRCAGTQGRAVQRRQSDDVAQSVRVFHLARRCASERAWTRRARSDCSVGDRRQIPERAHIRPVQRARCRWPTRLATTCFRRRGCRKR